MTIEHFIKHGGAAMRVFAWYYLVFELPLAVAVVMLILSSITGVLGDSGGELDHDVDHDLDHDLSHGVEVTDTDHGSTILEALSFLGVGYAPLSIILTFILLIWGGVGTIMNLVLDASSQNTENHYWFSMLCAAASVIFLTHYLAKLWHRFMPSVESYGIPNEELVGSSAEVRYTVTDAKGTAMLHDYFGVMRQVDCRVEPNGQELPPGTRVVLLDYDPETEVFIVIPQPLNVQRTI